MSLEAGTDVVLSAEAVLVKWAENSTVQASLKMLSHMVDMYSALEGDPLTKKMWTNSTQAFQEVLTTTCSPDMRQSTFLATFFMEDHTLNASKLWLSPESFKGLSAAKLGTCDVENVLLWLRRIFGTIPSCFRCKRCLTLASVGIDMPPEQPSKSPVSECVIV
jgi:hypothetical protein